jgi:hypothetical protein
MHYLRRPVCVDYSEDRYFDRLGIYDPDGLSSRDDLIDRIRDYIPFLDGCPEDEKPVRVMMCVHMGNELVRRFPHGMGRFRRALRAKMGELLCLGVMEGEHATLRQYLDQDTTD